MDNLKEKLINKYLSHFAESKKLGKSIDNYTELDLNCHKKNQYTKMETTIVYILVLEIIKFQNK